MVKKLVALGIFVLLVVSGCLLNKEKKMITINKIRLAESKRDLDLLDKILADEKQNKQKIEVVSETLPSDYTEVAFFAGQVESIGGKNGQTPKFEIDKTLKDEKDGLYSLKFNLKTAGSYTSFSTMLSQLAQFPYHTRFDSIKMLKTDGGGISTITTFKLLMTKK